jgi:hypothetical protein
VQRGQRCEHEDGEGRSPGKKDRGVAHQGGSGTDEVAALWRASATTAGSCSTGVTREVREAD